MAENHLVEVAVPLPIEGALTYRVPHGMKKPARGTRVKVPVGKRHMAGVVLGSANSNASGGFTIKDIAGPIDDTPLLTENLLDFILWVSAYYFYPAGLALSEALPPGFLSSRHAANLKIIEKGSRPGRSRFEAEHLACPDNISLTADQAEALSVLEPSIDRAQFSPVLIHGVTGSGKTEVYLRAAARCLEKGRNVLVMVPEIAMTAQTTGWFSARFGRLLSVLHSGMTPAQRRDQWWRIRSGKSPIVVGTRSAIFAPLPDIGLIIVDEEHDSSYKQGEKLRYNARDMALVLGRITEATVVLGSATPSLASYQNAVNGKYMLVKMKSRPTGKRLPRVEIIDRRKKEKGRRRKKSTGGKGTWLTPELELAINETISRNEQVMLFLNRRGFATYIFCTECGHVFRCRNCDVTMTWHRGEGEVIKSAQHQTTGGAGYLKCHYCGDEAPALPACPECSGVAVKALGFGTEKVEAEIRERFPQITTARIDRDVVSSTKRLNSIISRFRHRELDLIVGTQMITKGHDFPGLTLVGILWADMGLNVPEFNAAERTFQLITQVAGRAGRGDAPGRVLVQTWMADHFAIQAASRQDYEAFFEKEALLRKELGYAPFTRMINFRLSGTKKHVVHEASMSLAGLAAELNRQCGNQVEILGPAPAPRSRIMNRYRSQLLIKGQSLSAVRALCKAILSKRDEIMPSSVRLEVDVDPDNML